MPLCCCVLWCRWQRWSRGSSGSRQKARWITHSWPLTPARTNWSSVPGNPNQVLFFSFVLPLPLCSLLSFSFVVCPFIVMYFILIFFNVCLCTAWVIISFSIDVFKSQRKRLWRLFPSPLSLSSTAKCVCACVYVCVRVQFLHNRDTEFKWDCSHVVLLTYLYMCMHKCVKFKACVCPLEYAFFFLMCVCKDSDGICSRLCESLA